MILGLVEEFRAGREPSAVPDTLIDSFRATLSQKVKWWQSVTLKAEVPPRVENALFFALF